VIAQVKETVPGVVGNCTSGVAYVLAYVTAETLPILHVMSLLAGVLASSATFAYYIVQWRRAHAKHVRSQRRRYKRKGK